MRGSWTHFVSSYLLSLHCVLCYPTTWCFRSEILTPSLVILQPISLFLFEFFLRFSIFQALEQVLSRTFFFPKVICIRISNSKSRLSLSNLITVNNCEEVHVGAHILLGFMCILRGMSIMPLLNFFRT